MGLHCVGVGLAVSRGTAVKVDVAEATGVAVSAPLGSVQAMAARQRISVAAMILLFAVMEFSLE